MYLSIGNDMAVRDSSIIGAFDLDNTSKRTRAGGIIASHTVVIYKTLDIRNTYGLI